MAAATALAADYVVPFSERLADSVGKPLPGPVNLEVSFFEGSSTKAIKTLSFPDISLSDGVFQIPLTISDGDLTQVFPNTEAALCLEVKDTSNSVTLSEAALSRCAVLAQRS